MRFLSDLLAKAGLIVDGTVRLNSIANASIDTDKFLVSDGGFIKYRTGTQLLTDIGAQPAGTYVTSVGLTMPSAFNVANSPITGAGTLAVTGAGLATQYIRGDGQLATFPSTAGGGSSVNYYLNGSVASSVAGYQQMDNNAIIGGGTNFTLVGNGLIAQFLTDVGNPNRLQIPGGAWNFEMYFQVSSAGGNQKFYIELLKYNGSTFSLIASSLLVPEEITGGTAIDLYLTSLAVPTTALLVTDRLAIRVYIVDNAIGRTITLHTENTTLCEIITTFAGGIASLNGLTANTQYLATGTSGTDFNISSVSETHTFNLPTASSVNRGALSNTDWITFNAKVAGTGTTNYIPKWTSGSALGNSLIFDNGTNVGIGTTIPAHKLHIRGSIISSGGIEIVARIDGGTSVISGGINFISYSTDYVRTAGIQSQDIDGNNRALLLNPNGSNILIGSTTDNGNRLQVTGTSYFSDSVGIGTTTLTANSLRVSKNIIGAVDSFGITSDGAVQSTVTSTAAYFFSNAQTQATTFTLNNLRHFHAFQSTFGVGSTVVNQIGFLAESNLIGATNNFGFYGNISAGTNRWNIFMAGTANNYLAGALGIGSTSLTGHNLRIGKNITGSAFSYGVYNSGAIQSDVTSVAAYFETNASTAASSFTISSIVHYQAVQGTFGAGSTVSNQYGFAVNAGMTGAGGNFGFFGNLPSGSGRWNIFMAGTASNYLEGDTGIGTTTLGTATKFTIGGTETASSAISRGALLNTTLVASANNDILVGLDVNPTFTIGAFTNVVRYSARIFQQNALLIASDGGRIDFINNGGNGRIESSGGTLSMTVSSGNDNTFPLQIGHTNPVGTKGMSLAANVIRFQTGGFTTTVGQIFSTSGNWLLQNGGTFTDAGYRLDVNGTARVSGDTLINGQLTVNSSATQISTQLQNTFASASRNDVRIGGSAVYSTISAVRPSGNFETHLAFSTSAAGAVTQLEVFRATSSQNLLVGTTTDSGYKLDVNGTIRSTSSIRNQTLILRNDALEEYVTASDTVGVVINYFGYGGSILYYRNFTVYNGKGSQLFGITGSTGAATFASTVTASSLIKSGGTSTQYLMADGSTSTLTNPVTGTGTTNYLPKWTSASGIGNSLVYDNGTNVGINTIDAEAKLHVNGNLFIGGIATIGLQLENALTAIPSSNVRSIIANTQSSIVVAGALLFQPRTGVGAPILFSTEGSEKMRLTSTGNLGIGTASPSSLLHVNSGTTATQTVANFAAANYGSPSSRTYIQIGTQYGDGSSRIGSINTTGNQSALVFQTQSAASGVWNDAMYINGIGNLLINSTTDNGNRLQVTGTMKITGVSTFDSNIILSTNSSYIYFKDNAGNAPRLLGINSANSTYIGPIDAYAGGEILYGVSANVTNQIFYTAATERMRITPSGNLGLGVVPSAWDGTGAGGPVLQIGRALLFGANNETRHLFNTYYETGSLRYIASGIAATNYQQTVGQHRWFTAPSGTAGNAISFTQAMTLDASGNLGLGTTTPSNRLTVLGASPQIVIRSGASSTTNLQLNADGASLYTSIQGFRDTVGALPLCLQPSGGNLLVGTTVDSGERLVVSGNAKVSGQIFSSKIINSATISNSPADASFLLYAPTTTNYYGGIIGWAEGNLAASISSYDDGSGGALGLSFATGNNTSISERLKISSSGAATFSSSVTAGTYISNDATYGKLEFTGGTSNGVVGSFGNGLRLINFTATGTTTIQGNADININTQGSNNILFGTSVLERARFTAVGNLLVGTTFDSGERLVVSGAARVSGEMNAAGGLFISGGSYNIKRIYYNTNYGVVIAGGGGSSWDLSLIDRGGNLSLGLLPSGAIQQYVTIFTTNQGTAEAVNASALVEVKSTTQGFLPPRMTNAQRTAIGTPAVGLMVYCTDSVEGYYVYTSIGWKSLTMV